MSQRDDPRNQYRQNLDRLKKVTENEEPPDTPGNGTLRGNVSQEDYTAIRKLLNALDENHPGTVYHGKNGVETKQPKTLANYCTRLRLAATEADGPLLDQNNDTINQLMGDMASGYADIAPDNGYSKGTVGQYQSALKAFYRFHEGHDVDPEKIPVFASEDTSIDDRDMFSMEEMQAMRDVISSPRERCLFELLAYTGQRIRAIQSLRIKDIDLDKSVMYLNEEEGGLKGASGKRPLLGAEAYVRDLIHDYHPTKDPNDYLITPAATGGGTPGKMLSQDTIRYHLKKIAKEAGITKNVHPHIFRHYFTTIAKRDYNLDDSYIKHLRGDAPGSRVMETTYQHLSDDDAVEHASAKFNGREPEQESPLTPEMCPTCKVILEPSARACENCGSVFTPDAKSALDEVEEDLTDDMLDAETDTEKEGLRALKKILKDNPEMVLDALEDELE